LNSLDARLQPAGLAVLGGFHPHDQDDLPALGGDQPARSLVLIGNIGSALWGPFDSGAWTGTPNPLDRWTNETIGPIADEMDGRALYPFVEPGEAHWPFQQWVLRANIATASPLGILIHPDYGLWFALRVALLLPDRLSFPAPATASPCETCADKPCLDACPVDAFSPSGYDVAACRNYLHQTPGNDCMTHSCRARRACPVGREFTYEPAHAAFHMKAFA